MIDVGDRCPNCDEDELVQDELDEDLLFCPACFLTFEEDDA